MDGNVNASFELASTTGDSDTHERYQQTQESKTGLGTFITINRQLSALTIIAASEHAKKIKGEYMTQIARYTRDLTQLKSRLAKIPRDSSRHGDTLGYWNQDSLGPIMNIANLIEHVVTQIPALKKEIEDEEDEEGTYAAATKDTYEPAKSWIPGGSTIVTRTDGEP